MRILGTATVAAGSLAAVASLSGCGGEASLAPSAPAASVAVPLDQRASWMDPRSTSSDLIYIANGSFDIPAILVFRYPKGTLAGEIFGRGGVYGLCSDKAGDVFMPSAGLAVIYEYGHGGTRPIATLADKGQAPWGCAIEPKSGDLAVASFEALNGGPSVISIYKNAKGKPINYSEGAIVREIYPYIAYGSDGTIYFDGTSKAGAVVFATLKAGKFTTVTLNPPQAQPTAIAAVGSKVDILDSGTAYAQAIDRYAISGSTGTKLGSTPLNGVYFVYDFEVTNS